MTLIEQRQSIKNAQRQLYTLTEDQRVQALYKLADHLLNSTDRIRSANDQDLAAAVHHQLNAAMIDRLQLTQSRIEQMAAGVRAVADQPAVVGETVSSFQRPDGLLVKKQRIPLGVIGMIFESRPNVVIDCTALAIKSANAMVLKGGKEAAHSNTILSTLIDEAFQGLIPKGSITVLDSQNRDLVAEMLACRQLIDVVIPRGGEGLIRYVYEHATMPVIAHYKGLCHVYIDRSANRKWALDIALNAKVQRPGVCNAMETLLVDRELESTALDELLQSLARAGVTLRLDPELHRRYPQYGEAEAADWDCEYLDMILSVAAVDGVQGAIAHIHQHGSDHTEAIIADDPAAIDSFTKSIDSSMVAVNASTRFNDGGELGLGAELGISTSKIHAYGPMGAREMTTTRFVVEGHGHIRT